MAAPEVPATAGTGVDRALDLAEDAVDRGLDGAAELLDRVEALLAGRRDLPRRARLGQLRGEHSLATGDFAAAVAAFRASRRNWLATGRGLEAQRAELGRTAVMLRHGEYDDALPAVERVQRGLDQLRDADADAVTGLHATVHRQLGDVRIVRGEHQQAFHHYDLAEDLARGIADDSGVATVALRRGVALLDTGLGHRALDELLRAYRTYVRAGWAAASVRALVHIAEVLGATGQVARALELLDGLRTEVGGNAPDLAQYRLVRASALLRAGLTSEADGEITAAEEAFTELGMMERSARAALARSIVSVRTGQPEQAWAELAGAERLFDECGARTMRDTTWLLQARLALASGDVAGARSICRRLTSSGSGTAPTTGVRARLLAARTVADLDDADALLDEAAALATRTGSPDLRLDVGLGRARHHRRAGSLRVALDELRRTIEVGRVLESRAPCGSSRPVLSELVDELVGVLLDLGGHSETIEAWQRVRDAKTRALLPLAGRADGWIPGATGAERHRQVEQLLSAARAAQSRPRSSSLVRSEPGLPPVPEGPLLEYYVLGDDVVAFVVRDGLVHARRLTSVAAEARRSVAGWRQECLLMAATRGSSGATAPGPTDASSPSLDALYHLLVAPLADLLTDLGAEPLRVTGHRHLHAVPFDALLDLDGPWRATSRPGTEEPDTTDDDHDRLAEDASVLVLAVADDAAPAILDEAAMIARVLPHAELLVGEDATRARLAERAPTADLVHLACHGVFRSGNPLFSALRLGDGWLRAGDVLDGAVRLNRAVVVLSACASGLSSEQTPEPLGLAWACLAAGARGVVGALWAVDDEVTLELMTHFYGRLRDGAGPQAALHHARREVARTRPHPYHWAPFRYFSTADGQFATSATVI